MALGFLSTLQSISPFINTYRQQQFAQSAAPAPTQAEQLQAQAVGRQQKYLEALANPQSQIYKNLENEEYAQGSTDFLKTIREMQMADRRNQAMGRRSAFFSNPERRDEQAAALLREGYSGARRTARQAAEQRLGYLSTGQGQLAGQYSGMVEPQLQRQQQELRRNAMQFDLNTQQVKNFYDLLQGMYGK